MRYQRREIQVNPLLFRRRPPKLVIEMEVHLSPPCTPGRHAQTVHDAKATCSMRSRFTMTSSYESYSRAGADEPDVGIPHILKHILRISLPARAVTDV